MNNKKTYELSLGYFKQGDDLANAMEVSKTHADALSLHAERMQSVADHLKKVASLAREYDIEIDQADTHFIALLMDKEIGQKLCDEGLIYSCDPDAFEDDDDEDELLDESDVQEF